MKTKLLRRLRKEAFNKVSVYFVAGEYGGRWCVQTNYSTRIITDYYGSLIEANIRARIIVKELFPELKESEDEKIRKEIIENIRQEIELECTLSEDKGNRWIAWLEKQGEPKTTMKVKVEDKFERPNIGVKDAVEVTSRMQYISDDMKSIAEFVMEYASWNLHKDEWNHPVLEVPLFRVLDALIQKGKPYCVCSQEIKKQGEKPQGKMVNEEKVDNTNKIRQALIDLVKSYIRSGYRGVNNVKTSSMLNWLETHKYTEEDLDKAYKCADKVQYAKGYDDAKKEIEKQGEKKPFWSEKFIADVFEKVGLSKIVREQGNDELTNAVQMAMIELEKQC
ncbi:MAG: hypothetical protein K6G73_12245 [Marinilabiliaceae bacterium]|nr:hypothetical protein [Marinilabiliaceae bacterium]